MSTFCTRPQKGSTPFLIQVFIGLFLVHFPSACSTSGGTDEPCDGVTCNGGHCISDETGVRCECGDDLCLDPDDRLRCVQCPDADGDGDTDSDSDGDIDSDRDDEPDGDPDDPGPVITTIEGTGSPRDVNPWRPEDTAAYAEHEEHRVSATQRISSISRELIITGEHLENTERVELRHPEESTIELELGLEEPTANRVTVRFPDSIELSFAGILLTLVLSTSVDEVEAQVFFLRGEPGDSVLDCEDGTCTLEQDLLVEGSVTAPEGTFESLEAQELTVTMSVWLPECPPGYERDTRRDDIVLCTAGRDEMVKVGDFWVDRYEATVWTDADCTTGIEENVPYGSEGTDYPETFPYHGQVYNLENRLYACSVPDVTPSRYLTWFQAQSACTASGKRLISNAEWQAAVEGTVDPGASTADVGACRTGPDLSSPRLTNSAGDAPGIRGSCVSFWGAEDMIGNVWEWVADWYGQGGDAEDGSQPVEYFGDGYWNVDAADAQGAYGGMHFAPVGQRGGYWDAGPLSGAFSVYLLNAPSVGLHTLGFRCVRNY